MRQYLAELAPLLAIESRELIESAVSLRAIERLFQLIVDAAIDINTHIITSEHFPVPDDFPNTFIVLGEHKIIPIELAYKIAKSVGLRNLIVHKYGEVDVKRMVDDIKGNIDDYPRYMKEIVLLTEKS